MIGEESDFAIKMNRYFLTPIGIWPVEIVKQIYNFYLLLLSWISFRTLFSSCIIGVTDPGIRLRLIGPISFNIMAFTKYCSLVMKKGEI